ncbi:MAG: hypothetical protein BV459_04945, partial [Thermoplasmata archaeon M11B2D]
MTKLVEIQSKKTTVQCDNSGCDWNKDIEFDQIPEWHNKSCPCCGHSPIVSDDDLVVFNSVKALSELFVEVPSDEALR